MKGYYVIHDNDDRENARMGFAPHTGSTKSFVEKAPMPTTDLQDIMWEINWLGLLVNPSGFSLGIGKLNAKIWHWLFGEYPLYLFF